MAAVKRISANSIDPILRLIAYEWCVDSKSSFLLVESGREGKSGGGRQERSGTTDEQNEEKGRIQGPSTWHWSSQLVLRTRCGGKNIAFDLARQKFLQKFLFYWSDRAFFLICFLIVSTALTGAEERGRLCKVMKKSVQLEQKYNILLRSLLEKLISISWWIRARFFNKRTCARRNY